MSQKITKDILESHLHCKFKGHLKLTGQQGIKSDYETLLTETRAEVRLAAIEKILARHPGEEIPRNIPLTTSALKQRASFILDATLYDDLVSLDFDGLKKVDGPSKLGDFHYVPMLFSEGEKVRKEQRLLLELYGLLLSRQQGQMPAHGIIWHGKDCTATKVRLNADLRTTERMLRDLKEMRSAESPPTLILNDHCQVCEFRQRCQEQAVQEDNLSLLRGLGEKEIKKCGRKGIFTVTQLSHVFRPRKERKQKTPRTSHHRHASLQAMAIRDKRVYVFGTPEMPSSPVTIFIDMEGTPDEGFVYLIGVIVVEHGVEKRYSFWADSPEEEYKVFEQLLSIVAQYDSFVALCYGQYEVSHIKRMRKVLSKKRLVDKLLDSLVNALSPIYAHIYFPTYSNSLKDIGRYLGCLWTDPDSSGIQSLVWRAQWEDTHEDEWKTRLTLYNLEDCLALKKVGEFLLATQNTLSCSSIPKPPNGPSTEVGVTRVEEIEQLTNYNTWGNIRFANPDFTEINKCAYFDYQRHKVYIRTSKRIRRTTVKRKKYGRAGLRVTSRITITCPQCPFCHSVEPIAGLRRNQTQCQVPRIKKAYDLTITPSGIKRKVIAFRSSVYRCSRCGKDFVPEKYQRLDKYFHNLKCWSMFQYVAHGMSLKTVQSALKEFVGLHVGYTELYYFKPMLAQLYKHTYKKLLAKLLSGKLLHVDETEIKLRTGKGYIWVFTNLEEVYFLYKPTREGDFLSNLLKDFHGVLVSDFYSAYDAVTCPQQKCLIHLMRDMNQELLTNPYDDELKSITTPFGTLLRAIVATIDEHGLKRRFLKKHEQDVAKFCESLSAQMFHSEASEALQKRLMKYRDKVFTFLAYDGVPWNNNNAEHAIKDFAHYREDVSGSMTEAGLKDYLVLLSLCLTCKYKGVSFFQFLLSREKDVDRFCDGGRRNRRFSPVESYPKHAVPHYLEWLRDVQRRKVQSSDQATPRSQENS